ncbi:MAG: hypothetical protein WAU91_08970, partial [Desulfatitalea sp.]
MVCLQLCPDAWWINLSGRRIDQVDNVFVALAGRIEKGSCPNLVIIDDLDISPAAHHSYRDSLALILHRSGICGKGIIITARGGTSESAVVKDFKNVEVLDVPELSANEIETLFIEHGCPPEIADLWASIIAMGTGGHPKLVQVRLVELADLTWPRPKATDFTTQSSAITSARKMARHLLSESELGPIAEFVYLISLSSTLIHRSAAIRLAETVYG